jgi:hypothetical protein
MIARINVLFIGGAQRSGSTLLGRVLGTLPGYVHVGELNYLWERGLRGDQLCGCGLPFRECPFWSAVVTEAFGVPELPDHELDRLIAEKSRVLRLPMGALNALPVVGRRRTRTYAESMSSILQAILKVSGAEVIIDSSKFPTHGAALSQLSGVELYCAHLVRDCRAVCYSSLRVRRRPEIRTHVVYMGQGRPWRQTLRWDVYNLLVSTVARHSRASTQIRYEDFAAAPAEVVRSLFAKLAPLPLTGELEFPDNVFELPTDHTVSGNPGRFEQGSVSIEVDDEWRWAMSRRDRRIATWLSAPLLRRYRYI